MDLFVEGISLDVAEVGLKKLFENYGLSIKSAKILRARSTGFSLYHFCGNVVDMLNL